MPKHFCSKCMTPLLLSLVMVTGTAASTPPIKIFPAKQECPDITISCPTEGVSEERKTYSISVKVEGADRRENLTYHWSVSKGVKIMEGQGTTSVKISVDRLDVTTTVSVKVRGLEDPCENTRSCSFTLIGRSTTH